MFELGLCLVGQLSNRVVDSKLLSFITVNAYARVPLPVAVYSSINVIGFNFLHRCSYVYVVACLAQVENQNKVGLPIKNLGENLKVLQEREVSKDIGSCELISP